MRKVFLAILAMLLFASPAIGVESCTQSLLGNGPYRVYSLVWVTDASGNFTATATTQNIDGVVMLVEAIPSATAAPGDNYDVTLRNSSGIDVMGDSGATGSEAFDGALANLDTAVPSMKKPLLTAVYTDIPVMGPLTLDVFAAGNSKGGTIRIHFRRWRD